MPKPSAPKSDQKVPEKVPVEGSRLERKHRLSLQPQSVVEVPPGALRHTQSHRYDSQGKKKKKTSYSSTIPSILESESSEDDLDKGVVLKIDKTKSSVVYENEKRGSKTGVKVKAKEGNPKGSSYAFENAGFEGHMGSKRSSAATSSRAPSVQSLEIVREQYCCCAKRTKCERTLLTIVIVFGIIIVVLIIVIVFVAKRDDIHEMKSRLSLKK